MIAGATLRAQLLAVLAETCGKNGRVEEGLELVAKGLVTAEQTGMTVAEAELHRIKGDLLIATGAGSLADGERCLRTAIEVSRRQGARLFELRATVSLARLLRDPVVATRPARCSRTSTIGSPRASIPPTSSTPKPSSPNWQTRWPAREIFVVRNAELPIAKVQSDVDS